MYEFKSKYKYCLSTIDELQYVRPGDQPPNSYKDNAPKQKQPNYNLSTVNAISGSKYVSINNQQLTGNGVNQNEKIWHEHSYHNNIMVDGQTVFGTIKNYNKRRLFKKNNIIYDLTS